MSAACAAALWLAAAAAGGTGPVASENARAGTPGWQLPAASAGAIEGYTSQLSALRGEAISFHVSTQPAQGYRILVYRLGWYAGVGARLVACLPACSGAQELGAPQPTPAPDPSTGEVIARWPVTDTLTIDPAWTSGYYLAQLVLTTGPELGRCYPVFFVVREAPGRAAEYLVQVPVNTWEAYNGWGGKSLYRFNSTQGVPANRVSFDRPFAWGGFGQPAPFTWEIQLVRFLEREGYDVGYQTDVDTDAAPQSLVLHRAVIAAGHGEYWTKGMRDAFDAARDVGTNLAFMGANTGYWQVRYEDGGRTIVGYKSLADPYPDPALRTALFRDLGRPECELLGVEHLSGMGHADYSVNPAAAGDPWFAGTGLTGGSVLPYLVGSEFDAIPTFMPAPCAKPGLVDLLQYRGPLGNADAVGYTAPSGARVFASGSAQFSWGLDGFGTSGRGAPPPDARLQQLVRNLLADLGRPAPPAGVALVPRGGGAVLVRATGPLDPRVRERIYRLRPGGTPLQVCSASPCLDRPGAGNRVSYAAVAVDSWGSSSAAVSPSLRVPR